MGRPPKPTALKVLHGDFDKNPQRRNNAEPQVEATPPECPAWLKGEARNEWKRVCSELMLMKVVTLPDRAALEGYCKTYSIWRKALLHVEKHGMTLDSESGMYENPASKIAARCADQMHRYLCQFGMTPASRSRVNVTQQTAPVRMRRVR